MAYFVIGIGGTGAKCIEALTHLVAAGFQTPGNQPIYVMYVDPDQANGVFTRSKNLIANQVSCQNDFSSTFNSRIEFLTGNAASSHWQIINAANNQLSALVGPGDYKLSQLFFTQEELTTPLGEGFRGHPSIGACAISVNYLAAVANDPWNTFWARINADANSKIFIMGSIFGGTGAAGIPSLARLIDNNPSTVNPAGQKKVLTGSSLLLPYFNFDDPPGVALNCMHIKSGEFNNASKSALAFYWTKEHPIQTMYILGIDNNYRRNMGAFCAGGNNQNNDSHIVEMMSALSCLDYFNTTFTIGEPKVYKTIAYDNNSGITWDSIAPTVCAMDPISFKVKMYTYSIFCYFYLRIYSQIFATDTTIKNNLRLQTWYQNIVNKFKNKNELTDSLNQPKLVNLQSQCAKCLNWLRQINTGNILDPQFYRFLEQGDLPKAVYRFINTPKDVKVSDGELHNLMNSHSAINTENSISSEFVTMLHEATVEFVKKNIV
jgi:hypothetical protein